MLSLRAIAMALIGLVGFGISLRRPYLGLLLLVVLYFFRPDLWGAEGYVRPVLWLTIGVLIGWYRRGPSPTRSTALRWLAGLLTIYVVAQLASTLAPDAVGAGAEPADPQAARLLAGWASLLQIAKVFVVAFLIIELCDTPERLAGFALAVLAGSLWFVKVSFVPWAAVGFSGTIRINTRAGQGAGGNFIAWALASTVGFIVYKIVRGRGWQRLAAGALLPFWIMSILATGSRGGLVCLAAALGVCLGTMRQLGVLVLVTTVGVAFFLLAPAGRIQRARTITLDPEKMDNSMLTRYQHIRIGLKIMADHPLFGTGLDTFGHVKKKYEPAGYVRGSKELVAHNTLIQMGAECGLVLLAGFLLFNFHVLAGLAELPPKGMASEGADHLTWVRTGLLAAMAATAVQLLKGDMAKVDYFWWLYALAMAYSAVLTRVALATPDSQTVRHTAKRSRPPWLRRRNSPAGKEAR